MAGGNQEELRRLLSEAIVDEAVRSAEKAHLTSRGYSISPSALEAMRASLRDNPLVSARVESMIREAVPAVSFSLWDTLAFGLLVGVAGSVIAALFAGTSRAIAISIALICLVGAGLIAARARLRCFLAKWLRLG